MGWEYNIWKSRRYVSTVPQPNLQLSILFLVVVLGSVGERRDLPLSPKTKPESFSFSLSVGWERGQISGINGAYPTPTPLRIERNVSFPQIILRTKVIPSPQPLSLPTAQSLSREPRELPQDLTNPSTWGGRPAALISSGQLSSQAQVGRFINCNQVLQTTQQHHWFWVWGLQG